MCQNIKSKSFSKLKKKYGGVDKKLKELFITMIK